MNELFHVSEDASVVYSGLNGGIMMADKDSKAPKNTQTITKIDSTRQPGNICPWGEDNLFPTNVYNEAKKSTIIPQALSLKARMIYSGGIVAGTLKEDGDKDVFVPLRGKEKDNFRSFYRRAQIDTYIMKAAENFVWFRSFFPEIRMSVDGKEIADIDCQPSRECRFEWQNSRGIVENVYLDADWESANLDGTSKTTIKRPALNPYFNLVDQLKDTRASNLIYPVSYPGVGEKFYHLAEWNSVRESGWLDVSLSIPKFKKALLKNQMTIKYVITVDINWWKWKYPKWDTYDAKKRAKLKKEELSEFVKYMKGEENAGSAFMLSAYYDPSTRQYYGGWEIKALDDKLKDGIYIEDSQEASSHVLSAVGMDPTIVGILPGKGFGAGSGSDKRVAFNIQISLMKPYQDLVLKPLELKRDFSDDWTDEMIFQFNSPLINTLNSGEEITINKYNSNGTDQN